MTAPKTKERNLGGRPRLPKGTAFTEVFVLRLRPDDVQALAAEAEKRGVGPSVLARSFVFEALGLDPPSRDKKPKP